MADQPKEPANGEVRDDGRTPFERFEDLTKKLLRVPKSEIDKARAREKAKRAS